jgi:hypothetical protein
MNHVSLALLASAVLWRTSATFRYYVKMAVLYVAYMVAGTILIPYGKNVRVRGPNLRPSQIKCDQTHRYRHIKREV